MVGHHLPRSSLGSTSMSLVVTDGHRGAEKLVVSMQCEDPFITKDEEPGTYRPYDLGEEMGVWVNNSDGTTPAVGKAWPPGDSVFPDYTNPRTVEWWTQMCLEFKDVLDYDGIWIDMNEPSSFLRGQYPGCAVNDINNPPYVPSISDRSLAQKTLCPDSKTYLGAHYNTHSLFGWSQTAATF
ncbi:PREDICTED: lysosomal alpha-glucosidase-like, partial [Phaethon lepturus]